MCDLARDTSLWDGVEQSQRGRGIGPCCTTISLNFLLVNFAPFLVYMWNLAFWTAQIGETLEVDLMKFTPNSTVETFFSCRWPKNGNGGTQGAITLGWNKWKSNKDFSTPLMHRVFFSDDALCRSPSNEVELCHLKFVDMDLQSTTMC